MQEISEEIKKKSGFIAWSVMAFGIFSYDMVAIKTGKFETMSAAIWRNLTLPHHATPLVLIWGVLTHHLFVNHKARESYRSFIKGAIKNV